MRRMGLILTGAVVMAVVLAINVSTAFSATAQPGSMDTSFGNRGNVTTDFGFNGGEDFTDAPGFD